MLVSLPAGTQNDGSVVDKNGLIITADERSQILRNTHALPVFQEREHIKSLISKGHDVIIDGATGSGKSTGVPIFVRELGLKVIQTVPRVLAAMTCAERISKILLSETGNPDYTLGYHEVGYRTGGGGVSSKTTAKLSIHTDGLEMNRQLQSKIYPEVIILDEVQNLSIATELLMFIAKHKLDIQVIIMSATLDPNIYARYMESRRKEMSIISIPGKIFPIEEHYEKGFGSIEKTVELAKSGKHVLHLVSGKSRIDKVIAELQKTLGIGYEIIGLHAELTKEEQFRITIPPNDTNIVRIIVATNVAEESITIPYLNAVVDEGMHKVGRVSPQGIPELRVEPATLANTKQRRGRVGRTQVGEYFRFNDTPLEELHEYPSAQIENSTLEREILLFEKSNMPLYGLVGRAKDRGGEAFLHSIDRNLLNIGYERLTQIGALDSFGKITPLGEDLLTISLDPAHGRMIIEGIKRGLTEEMIVIASMFAVNSFLSKDEKWRQLKNGENKKSDIFTYLDLFDLVTKKRIAQDILERLVYLGIEREQILEFQKEGNEKALYECVDLSHIGIKNHRIAQIVNKITQLQNSFLERGIKVDKTKKISGKQIHIRASEKGDTSIQDVLTCIISGQPYFTFRYRNDDKKLYQQTQDGILTTLAFKKAAVSSLTLTEGKIYHGIPFIIGSEEIQDDLGLSSNERFFDTKESIGSEDLNIVSHISEVPDHSVKEAVKTQLEYKTVFPNIKKGESHEYISIEDIRSRYNSLTEEFSNGEMSNIDFLKYALPLFIMLNNYRFKKFLENKYIETVVGMEQRLQKYFIHESNTYLPRIHRNIATTENSFLHDSEIYSHFRDWEQKHMNAQKKKKPKHISRSDADEVQKQRELYEATLILNKEIGLFSGSVSQLDEIAIKRKQQILVGSLIQDMKASGETYNKLLSSFENEFGMMTEEERKAAISETHGVENTKTELNSIRTRMSQLQQIIREIEKLIDFSKSRNDSIYNTINLDFCREIFEGDTAKNKNLTTKSQIDKFYSGISTLENFMLDRKNPKFIGEFPKTLRGFESMLRVFSEELSKLSQELDKKIGEIQERKLSSFHTRRELHIFFSKYYDDSYFHTVIERKIASILVEAIHNKNIDGPLENRILNHFSLGELKVGDRTRDIHAYLQLIKQYNDLVNNIQKSISTYNRGEIIDIEGIQTLTQIIEEGRGKLSDIKSQIFS